jgi:hypothetical protein
MPLLALSVVVTLLAAADGGDEPLRVRVMFGTRPAPTGTMVRLWEPSPLCGTAQYRLAPHFPTDAEGWVTFERATARGSVTAEHPALGSVSAGVTRTAPMVLTFPDGVPLSGVVLDDRGAPADNANVYLVRKELSHQGVLVTSNVGTSHLALRNRATWADGRFEFLGLGPGTYAVFADDTSGVPTEAVVVDAGAGPVTLRLKSRFRVEGRVVDPDGKPVANARVIARLAVSALTWPNNEQTVDQAPFEKLLEPVPEQLNPKNFAKAVDTAADGTFSVPIAVKGPVMLQVNGDCASVTTADLTAQSGHLELRLPARATLEGRAVGPNGKPLTHATVHVDSDTTCSSAVQPLDLTDGRFSLSVPSGIQAVTVTEGALTSKWLPVHAAPGATTKLGVVKLQRATP